LRRALNVSLLSGFVWTAKRQTAALKLAEGFKAPEVALTVGTSERTIWRWLADMEFNAEVDRLSLMIGIASRAERLRIASRVIRQKVQDAAIDTQKDLLEWLKFAQSETDGVNLNLAQTFLEATAPVAGSGQGSVDSEANAA